MVSRRTLILLALLVVPATCDECDSDWRLVSLTVYFFLTVAIGLCGVCYVCIRPSTSKPSNTSGHSSNPSKADYQDPEVRDRDPDAPTRATTESWQIHFKDLRFGRLIGRGNVGKVYDGRWRSQKVAIKMLLGGWLKDEEMVERFRDEIYLMSTMHHPNVLLFVGATMDPSAGNICLVTELCSRGNLSDFLQSDAEISWQLRIQMAHDIACGMHYLHGRAGIIQRDLKTANLLVNEFNQIKIADFGLAREIAPAGQMGTYCGTPATMAPEIVLREDYNEKADMFSFGIILWELLTREEPYPGNTGLQLAYDVAHKGLRPPIPAYCPAEYADIMTRAWDRDPAKRPDFLEVMDSLSAMQRALDDQIRKQAALDRLMQEEESGPPRQTVQPSRHLRKRSGRARRRNHGTNDADEGVMSGAGGMGGDAARSKRSRVSASNPSSRGNGASMLVGLPPVTSHVGGLAGRSLPRRASQDQAAEAARREAVKQRAILPVSSPMLRALSTPLSVRAVPHSAMEADQDGTMELEMAAIDLGAPAAPDTGGGGQPAGPAAANTGGGVLDTATDLDRGSCASGTTQEPNGPGSSATSSTNLLP